MNRARLFLHERKEEREKERKGKAEGGEEEELEEREKIRLHMEEYLCKESSLPCLPVRVWTVQ